MGLLAFFPSSSHAVPGHLNQHDNLLVREASDTRMPVIAMCESVCADTAVRPLKCPLTVCALYNSKQRSITPFSPLFGFLSQF